ncbi:TPA: ribonuclease P protein component [Streptococcus agalactiae]|nr:ribonuclease P protein component [Streptococcus agalactiae]
MKKTYRVKSDKDFQMIFSRGKNVANRKFVIYYLEKEQKHFRVGISVSKKLGNAVVRNAIKRKIRHVLLSQKTALQDYDFVVIARKGVEELDYQALEKNLIHVLKIAGLILKGIKLKKKLKTFSLILLTGSLLVACGRGEVSSHSATLWEQIVYAFAKSIQWLSFNHSIGLGIILFTLIIRAIMMPLYNMQMKSSQKMQEIQPRLKELQKKYPGKDPDSRLKLNDEMQSMYKAEGVNPYASVLPLLIQLPVLWALFQALTRVSFLKVGTFLSLELSQPDPYYILPVLAALFTFLSTWLTNKAAVEKNIALTLMTYVMPLIILVTSFNFASGVVLYWTVSNAFQVFQILLLNNPYKIIKVREEAVRVAHEKEQRVKRAKRKASKKRK